MAMEDEVPLSVTEVGSTNITATATLATEARGGNGPKQNSAEAPSSHLYREPSASNARVDECETERKDARKGGGLSYYGRVFGYTDRTGWIMNTIALACMVASGTLLPLMDFIFGKFVTIFNNFATGAISPSEYRDKVNKYTLFFVYLFIGKFLLSYIWMTLISITATKTIKALRVDFVRQVLRQEIAFFDNPGTSIASQLTTNAGIINQGISEKLGLIIQALSSFVTAFIVAFAINAKLTAIIVAIVPVNIIGTNIFVALDAKIESNILGIFSTANSLAEEVFSTIRTAHAFWARPKLGRKFEAILDKACEEGMKKSPVYAGLFSVEYFCIYSAYGLAFWQGIRLWSNGEIANPGDVVTVMFAVIVATQSLTIIAPQATAISKAVAAATEVFRIIDRESKLDSLSGSGVKPVDTTGAIELRSVGFAYPSRPTVDVLKGLTLSIPAKKTTALVGPSGSGKSSIVNLLERWYEWSSGSITLDGIDIRDINVRWLRENVRLVEQEPTLFSGTVIENVAKGLAGTRLATRSADEKRELIEEACRSAFAHDFIQKLPKGYDTFIGEKGATLSGGQKQRIVIARSIVSNPQVLLLDEATSALDPHAEKIVQEALDNVGRHRTMVVIAHRLATIRNADNIVVMSEGMALEQGTHAELMRAGGAYARLVQAQDLGQESGASGDGKKEVPSSEEKGPDEKHDSVPVLSDTELSQTRRGLDTDGSDSQGRTILAEDGVETRDGGSRPVSLVKCILLICYEQRAQWVAMLITFITCALGGLTNTAIAILFADATQAFELDDEHERVKRGDFYSLMFFVVALGILVIYATVGWVTNMFAQRLIHFYKREMFETTLRQNMSFFDDPRNTIGSLASRLASEPANLQELLSANLGLIVINIVNLGSCCVLALVVGWKLGLVLVFGALPLLVLSGYVRIRLDFKLDSQTSSRFAWSSGLASEAVRAIRTVSSLTLEKSVIKEYEDTLRGIEKKSLGSIGLIMFFYSLSQSISFLAMALGFWYGGRLVSTGEYTTRQFYIVFIAIIFSGESAALFFTYGTSITKAKTSANYIFNLRNRLAQDEARETGHKDVPPGSLPVEFDNVDFAYQRRPDEPVLRDINLKVDAAKFVGLVGHSGCGKTTMVSLIQRFYDPTRGRVMLGDENTQDFELRKFRSSMAIVRQEPELYTGSIRDNISLGVEEGEPTDDDVLDALRQANIYDFVLSLPEGLQTSIGSYGTQLSGGQKQRLCLARALIRKPRILLLDEATSALDTHSEKLVKEALEKAAQGRTTISIAHRLSTIKDADMIVVLSGGQIQECGTHEELVMRRGVYFGLCLGQALDGPL